MSEKATLQGVPIGAARNTVLPPTEDGSCRLDISSPTIPVALLLFDAADFDFVRRHRWSPWKATNGTIYATAEIVKGKRRERVLLHRQIIRARFDEIVDHINGNGLDNRSVNLRLCKDNTLNLANRHIRRASSGFWGVAFRKGCRKPWLAHMTVKGKQNRIGYFDTAEDAARARDKFARSVYGEFASVNFPDNGAEK